MIYLASPYSHPDPHVREERFEAVCRVAAELIRAGHSVYSPIVHSHPLAKFGLPTGWDFWERHCLEQISRCVEVVVLTLEGWDESVGVQEEIRIAEMLGLRVSYQDSPIKSTLARFAKQI